jgi:outer membrane protein OmpA-like peptidoglycan-associated protein
VQEALDDPDAFFARCGRPLYLSGDLLFDLDDDHLRPAAEAQVRRLSRLLKSSPEPGRELVITGHADQRGEDFYNDSLSARRAQRVTDVLVADGAIESSRITVVGRGRRDPIVPASAPTEQQRFNRRVEVVVPCQKGQR